MTSAVQRKITRQIRGLRADRKAWLTGQRLHWGMSWCHGPGSPYHQPPCEGCATVLWCRDQAARITPEIERLEALACCAGSAVVTGVAADLRCLSGAAPGGHQHLVDGELHHPVAAGETAAQR